MARRRLAVGPGQSGGSGEFAVRLLLIGALLLLIIFLALAGVGAGLTYYVTTSVNSQESVTPQTYLLNSYLSINFNDHNGGEHEGWLLLGLRGAPAIILCPGYDTNRSDLLSLGSVLRDNHFNVYIFNFHGPKAKETRSNLGPRQASDLLAAIDTVTRQPDVNPNRVGLFGTSVGGYAVLVAGETNPKVKVLAVDTTYSTPELMFDSQVDRLLGGSSGLFHVLTEAEFHIATMGRETYDLHANMSKLANIPKLFISGRDNPTLATMTEELYNQAPEPKQLLVMEHSGSGFTSVSDKREYEEQILNFFQQKLSLRSN